MTQFNERVTIYQYMDATLNHQAKAEIECKKDFRCANSCWGFPECFNQYDLEFNSRKYFYSFDAYNEVLLKRNTKTLKQY